MARNTGIGLQLSPVKVSASSTSAKGQFKPTGAIISPSKVLSGTVGGVAPIAPIQASVSKLSGTNQASSAASQSSLDASIKQLQDLAKSNSQQSQAMADAANRFTAQQSQQAMEFSAAEAAKNRDWQKMMSDTAHQREVKDLLAAGLNPVLSATGGNGAAVTSGATASGFSGSGQKGEVDMETSRGLVSLLSSMLAAQTQLASTAMSAKTNEAIADKANATSKLVAMLTGQYSLAREDVAGKYSLARQDLSDRAALQRVLEQEFYSNYRARLSSAASRYAADKHLAASVYGSDMQYAIHRDFPNSTVGAIASILSMLTGGDSGNVAQKVQEYVKDPGKAADDLKQTFVPDADQLRETLVTPFRTFAEQFAWKRKRRKS